MKITGFVAGALGLIALEVATSSAAAANRTAALPSSAAGLARRLLDPDVALLPNWHDDNAPKRGAPAAASPATGLPGTARGGATFTPPVLRQAHGG